jgi:hypothetical protein
MSVRICIVIISSYFCRGLWNVLAVSNCYVARGDVIRNSETRPSYSHPDHQDPDMAFSFNLKNLELEIFLSNREDFGYIVNHGKMGTCAIFSCGSMELDSPIN